ncbi:MAG: hypothetical protein KY443_07125 [Actinobacteria bacterium]|nr:hypothetical protein [Actinomycetota bacterium]
MTERRTIPIACTLEPAALPARLAAWHAVVGESVAEEPVEGGVRLRFARTPGLPARLAALAEAEQGCCGFFEFRVGLTPEDVTLDITAPPDARPLIDTLLNR